MPRSWRAARCAARTLAFVVLCAGSACTTDISTPPLPTTISASVSSVNLDAVGAEQVVGIVVRDQSGAVMSDVPLGMSVGSAAVASVTGRMSATVVAVGNGSTTLTIRADTARATVAITVVQLPVAPLKLSGDVQSAPVGGRLASPVRVRIQDRKGAPVAGRVVAFTPTYLHGTVSPATATSGADGIASTTWTLGTAPGTQSLSATTIGIVGAATFVAIASAGAPTTVSVSAGDAQVAMVATVVATAPAVRVADAFNNPVSGVTVTFAAASGSGAITDAVAVTNTQGVATVGSWTLGTTTGSQSLTATVVGVTPRVITATATSGTPTSLVVAGGNAQTALAGATLPLALAVTVKDQYGNNAANVPVAFAVTAGGGTITPGTATTNASGLATGASWRLGNKGGTQTATATVGALSASFTATTQSNFPVTLRYFGNALTLEVQTALTAAVNRVRAAIVSPLVNTPLVNANLATCHVVGLSGILNESTQGVIIYVSVGAVDGAGGLIAQAGPCFARSGSGLPIVGTMVFDFTDIGTYISSGRFDAIVLHEMNHVLGFGTVWGDLGLVTSPAVDTGGSATGSTNPRFIGTAATAQCVGAGGVGVLCTGATGVALEATGGRGTADSHWRESLFINEVMTGYIDVTPNMPWSPMSVASFQDLGYTVNLAAADAWTVPSLMAMARARVMSGASGAAASGAYDAVHRATFEVTPSGVTRPINRTPQ